MTDFLIADTHFGHANIIRHCARPFADVEEMNATLMRNWNATVAPSDTVYMLGDFSFKSGRAVAHWYECLNGEKRFVLGNHDRKELGWPLHRQLSVRGVDLWLTHYPGMAPLDWQGWTVHGHTHNNDRERPYLHRKNRSVNVGVELIGYTPVSVDEVVDLILAPGPVYVWERPRQG